MKIVRCSDGDHDYREMHHYEDGPNGSLLHYCPTGFKQCANCGEVEIAEPEEQKCFLQGLSSD